MRIVSLLAAATEWVAAVGASDLLVARSHECDYPDRVRDLPVVTSSNASGEDSRAIDQTVRSTLKRGLSLFDVDLEMLKRLQPDLILTQTQCDVCAVSAAQLEALLAGALDPAPEIFSFDPRSMKDVLEHVMRLGRTLDRLPATMAVIAENEKRLRTLQEHTGISKRTPDEHRPSVVCIEWLEPLMTSGNWVPDLVALAGGQSLCAAPGERSGVVSWDDVIDADPDYLAVMPCGFDIAQTRAEFGLLSERSGWDDMKAVRTGRVFLFDGQAYFNRPGPRLYRSIELMAGALHGFAPASGIQPWEAQRIISSPQSAG